MSIPYQNIAKRVALRAKQIVGGDSAALNTALAAANISTYMDGVDVPYAALKLDILAAEAEIALAIGNDTNSVHRIALAIQSGDVANKGTVPTQSTGGVPFIGLFDGIFDSSDNTALTEQPKQWVDRRTANPGSFFKIDAYYFHIEGTKIMHTRTNVYFRGCGWKYSTQSSSFDAQSTSPLPAELEDLWICKVLARLPQEQWFIQEGGYYYQQAAQAQSALISGRAASMNLPQIPNKTATTNSVVN